MYHLKVPNFVRRAAMALPVCMAVLLGSCGESADSYRYDPGKPARFDMFYPDSGQFQANVMLVGDNFPTDPALVKVFFNGKQATVTGSSGTRLTALAPRLPGGKMVLRPGSKSTFRECKVSMLVGTGTDTLKCPNLFIYEETVTATTVTGKGTCDLVTGSLSDAAIQPAFICADRFGNVFVSNRAWFTGCGDDKVNFLRVNEEEDIVELLTPIQVNVPYPDPVTGVIIAPSGVLADNHYYMFDPANKWAPKSKYFDWITPENNRPRDKQKHCMAINPKDGCFYTQYGNGEMVKIDPVRNTGEVIFDRNTGYGNAVGITFRPGEPDIMYMAFNELNELRHAIYTMDVGHANPGSTFKRVSASNTSGHNDGRLDQALFNAPNQMFTDWTDGSIYIADTGNHCIRRITPDNQVETVLGIPGVPGEKNGSKKEAQFNNPTGIAIAPDGTIYVADRGSASIRKIAVN